MIHNKTKAILFLFLIYSATMLSEDLRTITNKAFKRGEELRYRVYYQSFITGKVNAGEALLEVKNENRMFGSRPSLHIIGWGLSKGAFNLFFKVVDKYETYIDEQAMVPLLFYRRVNEGGFKIEQDIVFNQYNSTAIDTRTNVSYKTTANVQDLLSAFYYARVLDYESAKPGAEFVINTFIDFKIYPLKMKLIARETLTTTLGDFKALKFIPMFPNGDMFKEDENMTIWVSDDINHIPIMVKGKMYVGSIIMELIKYNGLANPLTSKIVKKKV